MRRGLFLDGGKTGINIPSRMEYPDNIDSGAGDSIKNHVLSHGKATQTIGQFFADTSHPWICRKRIECFVDAVDKSIRTGFAIFRDIAP